MAKKILVKGDKGKKDDNRRDTTPATFAFGRDNYLFILIGIGVLILGYVLMIGGGSDDPNEFNPEIFSTQRVTVAPVTLLIGFGIVLYGIMKKPKV
ncbi:MAG TPA: DUF3098 domain-containing protein [Bacteroidia bacterium]|nr:DUF3098 domain-containing protein [Bacteroidia bacterium]